MATPEILGGSSTADEIRQELQKLLSKLGPEASLNPPRNANTLADAVKLDKCPTGLTACDAPLLQKATGGLLNCPPIEKASDPLIVDDKGRVCYANKTLRDEFDGKEINVKDILQDYSKKLLELFKDPANFAIALAAIKKGDPVSNPFIINTFAQNAIVIETVTRWNQNVAGSADLIAKVAASLTKYASNFDSKSYDFFTGLIDPAHKTMLTQARSEFTASYLFAAMIATQRDAKFQRAYVPLIKFIASIDQHKSSVINPALNEGLIDSKTLQFLPKSLSNTMMFSEFIAICLAFAGREVIALGTTSFTTKMMSLYETYAHMRKIRQEYEDMLEQKTKGMLVTNEMLREGQIKKGSADKAYVQRIVELAKSFALLSDLTFANPPQPNGGDIIAKEQSYFRSTIANLNTPSVEIYRLAFTFLQPLLNSSFDANRDYRGIARLNGGELSGGYREGAIKDFIATAARWATLNDVPLDQDPEIPLGVEAKVQLDVALRGDRTTYNLSDAQKGRLCKVFIGGVPEHVVFGSGAELSAAEVEAVSAQIRSVQNLLSASDAVFAERFNASARNNWAKLNCHNVDLRESGFDLTRITITDRPFDRYVTRGNDRMIGQKLNFAQSVNYLKNVLILSKVSSSIDTVAQKLMNANRDAGPLYNLNGRGEAAAGGGGGGGGGGGEEVAAAGGGGFFGAINRGLRAAAGGLFGPAGEELGLAAPSASARPAARALEAAASGGGGGGFGGAAAASGGNASAPPAAAPPPADAPLAAEPPAAPGGGGGGAAAVVPGRVPADRAGGPVEFQGLTDGNLRALASPAAVNELRRRLGFRAARLLEGGDIEGGEDVDAVDFFLSGGFHSPPEDVRDAVDTPLNAKAEKARKELAKKGIEIATYKVPQCPVFVDPNNTTVGTKGQARWIETKDPWTKCQEQLGVQFQTPDGFCYPSGMACYPEENVIGYTKQTENLLQHWSAMATMLNQIKQEKFKEWLAGKMAEVRAARENALLSEKEIKEIAMLQMPAEFHGLPEETAIYSVTAAQTLQDTIRGLTNSTDEAHKSELSDILLGSNLLSEQWSNDDKVLASTQRSRIAGDIVQASKACAEKSIEEAAKSAPTYDPVPAGCELLDLGGKNKYFLPQEIAGRVDKEAVARGEAPDALVEWWRSYYKSKQEEKARKDLELREKLAPSASAHVTKESASLSKALHRAVPGFNLNK